MISLACRGGSSASVQSSDGSLAATLPNAFAVLWEMLGGGRMDKFAKDLVRQLRKSRSFPTNTCPYSRHAQMIGENLVRGKPYPMLQEEAEHCGGSILATVLALYEARNEITRLTASAPSTAESKSES